jgi:hypothetical protein
MNDQVRGGVIKLALAAGILYLFVTGGLAKFTGQLSGGVSGAPVAKAYPFRATLAAHAAAAKP